MSDEQTDIFSSYHGMNDFSYFLKNLFTMNKTIAESPDLLSDLEQVFEKALKHLEEYDIPKLKLKAELLGYHIDNLSS